MNLEKFIADNSVEQSNNLVDVFFLKEIENKINITIGNELKEYLLKYGYLAYGHVELYGINSKQRYDSDMIKQTLYLHKYFIETNSLIAIENQGEGIYYLVDKEDNIYEYDSFQKKLSKTAYHLFDYILNRFIEVK